MNIYYFFNFYLKLYFFNLSSKWIFIFNKCHLVWYFGNAVTLIFFFKFDISVQMFLGPLYID